MTPDNVVLARLQEGLDRLEKIEQEQEEAKRLLDQTVKDYKQLEKEVLSTKDDFQKQSTVLEGSIKEVKHDKLQAIQILALFIGFFTFVSVQFQLFAVLKDGYMIIALSLLLLGALLVFVCLTNLRASFIDEGNYGFKSFVKTIVHKGSFYLCLVAFFIMSWGICMAAKAHNLALEKRDQKQAGCTSLAMGIEQDLQKESSPATDFLQKRYQNECSDFWAD